MFIRFFFVIIIILSFLASEPWGAIQLPPPESPENTPMPPLLLKASACKTALFKSPQKKYRSRWLSCISKYQKVVKGHFSEDSTQTAVSELIALYHQLGRYSGKKSDKAKEQYWKDFKSQLTTEPRPGTASSSAVREPEEAKSVGKILNIRTRNHGNYLRIVLDLTNPVTYETHEIKENDTLQIDFFKTAINPGLESKLLSLNSPEMKVQLLDSLPDKAELSITHSGYQSFKISQLPAPPRWIIDLKKPADPPLATQENGALPPPFKKRVEGTLPPLFAIRKIIIDPGHGGKDPGAIGLSGFTEKEAVLDIGLRLRELLTKELKMNVIMTRSRDIFIPLEERAKIANEANADLFISIHANSSRHRTAQGVEIYLLGKASDKKALRTAARENNSTEEEATNLDKNLMNIKKDLVQEFKKEESLELAHITRSTFMTILRPSYPVVDLGVKTAPFYVLMNTAMPSILAEVSFISNPAEEMRLKSKSFRQKTADSLFEGIKKYIEANSMLTTF